MTERDQLFRAFLAAGDAACPVCAYNLRAIESQCCPECGAQLELRLGSSDLRLAPWLTGIIIAAVLIGLLLVIVIICVVTLFLAIFRPDSTFFGPGDEERVLLPFALGAAAIPGALIVLLVRYRRWIWRRRPRIQWALVALSLIITVSVTGVVLFIADSVVC